MGGGLRGAAAAPALLVAAAICAVANARILAVVISVHPLPPAAAGIPEGEVFVALLLLLLVAVD